MFHIPVPNDNGQPKQDTEEIQEVQMMSDMTDLSSSMITLVPVEPRRRRAALPYTFHYIHGKNIKLCSSGNSVYHLTI